MTTRRRTDGSNGSEPGGKRAPRRTGPVAPDSAWGRLNAETPPWLPALLYAAVTVVLFREFIVSDLMLFGTDTISLGYVARDFYARAVRDLGVFPLWNPYILGGTPFVESLVGGDIFYPTTVLKFFMETHRALGWKLVIHVFLAGVFTYGWLRALDRSRIASTLGGLAYLLAPFLVTLVYPGHDGKLFVTALTPLLFWTVEESLSGARWWPFAAMAATVALVLLTPHFQMAYFLFGAVGLYALFRTVRRWRRTGQAGPAASRFGLFLLAAVLGASAAGAQLFPSFRYVTEHSRRTATTTRAADDRGLEYSSSWSLHPEEVASFVVPEFVGNDAGGADWTSGTYWGRNPFKLNHEYFGLVVLLLAPLAFFGGGGRSGAGGKERRWFFLGLGLLALLFALGRHTPVWRVFYEVLPGVSLFRAPSMVAFLTGFSAITLSAYGIDRLVGGRGEGAAPEHGPESAGSGGGSPGRAEGRALPIYLWSAAGGLLLLGLLASAGVLTGLWVDLLHGGGLGPRKSRALERATPFLERGFLLAALLAVGLAGVWHLRRLGSRAATIGCAGLLGLLLLADAWRVDAPFIQTEPPARFFAPAPTTEYLLERKEEEPPFRTLSLRSGGQDVRPALHGLELAAGHHPNDLARYRDLIGMEGSGAPVDLLQNLELARMLNVRYLVAPDRFRSAIGRDPVAAGGGEAVYRFPEALPRALLVGRAVIREGQEALAYLKGGAFRPASEAVLPAAPPVELPGEEVEGRVSWIERGLNRMRLEVETDRNALLVIAENWYPDWHARVDGVPVPLLRANHTLRAVPLEAGSHEVEIRYRSSLFVWSLRLSLGVWLLLVVSGGVSWIRARRVLSASGSPDATAGGGGGGRPGTEGKGRGRREAGER